MRDFPEQPFVLDHIAKPMIAQGLVSPWQESLLDLAKLPNVSCKLSGMVTEARWRQWQPLDFHRYMNIVVEAFGSDRLMIGSDWPVCLLSGDYRPVMQFVIDYVQQFPVQVRTGILGENCARIYKIHPQA